jgi:hypothetical protein
MEVNSHPCAVQTLTCEQAVQSHRRVPRDDQELGAEEWCRKHQGHVRQAPFTMAQELRAVLDRIMLVGEQRRVVWPFCG